MARWRYSQTRKVRGCRQRCHSSLHYIIKAYTICVIYRNIVVVLYCFIVVWCLANFGHCDQQPYLKTFQYLQFHRCAHGVCLGWILIDRSGKHFGAILTYLRDGSVTLPKSRQGIMELQAEAKYYLIQSLVEVCQRALQVWMRRDAWWPVCDHVQEKRDRERERQRANKLSFL